MKVRFYLLVAPLLVFVSIGCTEDKSTPAPATAAPVAKAPDKVSKSSKAKRPKEVGKSLGPEGVVD